MLRVDVRGEKIGRHDCCEPDAEHPSRVSDDALVRRLCVDAGALDAGRVVVRTEEAEMQAEPFQGRPQRLEGAANESPWEVVDDAEEEDLFGSCDED